MKAQHKLLLAALLLLGAWLFLPPAASQPPAPAPHSTPTASLEETTAKIRALARSGAPITLSRHARERMAQRNFGPEDIRETLAHGDIRQPPRLGKKGDLLYKVEHENMRGERDGEVVVIPREAELFIVTVYWDDE